MYTTGSVLSFVFQVLLLGCLGLLIFGIVSLYKALSEKKAPKQLDTVQTLETRVDENSAPTASTINEQMQAVQVVHSGLENVMTHLKSAEGERPEMVLSEIGAEAEAQGAKAEIKHCSKCDAPLDSSFEFCLKCSQSSS